MICMPIGKPLSVRAIGIVVDGSPFKGAARHRADHRKVTADRDRRGSGEARAALRNEVEARFVGEDAAEMRRRAQRAADIPPSSSGTKPAASAAAACHA
jgi:hypothetical protein